MGTYSITLAKSDTDSTAVTKSGLVDLAFFRGARVAGGSSGLPNLPQGFNLYDCGPFYILHWEWTQAGDDVWSGATNSQDVGTMPAVDTSDLGSMYSDWLYAAPMFCFTDWATGNSRCRQAFWGTDRSNHIWVTARAGSPAMNGTSWVANPVIIPKSRKYTGTPAGGFTSARLPNEAGSTDRTYKNLIHQDTILSPAGTVSTTGHPNITDFTSGHNQTHLTNYCCWSWGRWHLLSFSHFRPASYISAGAYVVCSLPSSWYFRNPQRTLVNIEGDQKGIAALYIDNANHRLVLDLAGGSGENSYTVYITGQIFFRDCVQNGEGDGVARYRENYGGLTLPASANSDTLTTRTMALSGLTLTPHANGTSYCGGDTEISASIERRYYANTISPLPANGEFLNVETKFGSVNSRFGGQYNVILAGTGSKYTPVYTGYNSYLLPMHLSLRTGNGYLRHSACRGDSTDGHPVAGTWYNDVIIPAT